MKAALGKAGKTWSQPSPIGRLEVEVGPEGVRLLDVRFRDRSRKTEGAPDRKVADALDRYFDGDLDVLEDLPVDLSDSPPFRRKVLETLRRLGPGELTSYGKLAAEAGRMGANRAVGQAVGHNPVAVIIPCHRVIAADGTLGGFGMDLDCKRWLLAHEGVPALAGGWEPGLRR